MQRRCVLFYRSRFNLYTLRLPWSTSASPLPWEKRGMALHWSQPPSPRSGSSRSCRVSQVSVITYLIKLCDPHQMRLTATVKYTCLQSNLYKSTWKGCVRLCVHIHITYILIVVIIYMMEPIKGGLTTGITFRKWLYPRRHGKCQSSHITYSDLQTLRHIPYKELRFHWQL